MIKTFSIARKMALMLFIVVCVSSAMASMLVVHTDKTDWDGKQLKLIINSISISNAGSLTFKYTIGYSGSTTTRYADAKVELLDKDSDQVLKVKTLLTNTTLKNNGNIAEKTGTLDGVKALTGCSTIEELCEADYAIKITVGASNYSYRNETWNEAEAWRIYMKDSGVLSSGTIRSNNNTEAREGKVVFLEKTKIFGEYQTNKGISKIIIHYVSNEESFENAKTGEAILNSDGTYEYQIPDYITMDLRWKVVSYIGEDVVEFRNRQTAFKINQESKHESNNYYTWVGGDNGIWGAVGNWVWDYIEGRGQSYFGYPGKKTGSYYVSKAIFNTNAEVDLNGQEYYLWDANRGFEMAEGIIVKMKNGTLGFQPHDDGNPVVLNLGTANSTLVLSNVKMPYKPDTDKQATGYQIKPVQSSTIVIEGTTGGITNYNWSIYPGSKNTKFNVINGTVLTSYYSANPGEGSEAMISNGVWIVKAGVNNGIANKMIFRDGQNSQGRLWVRQSAGSSTYYNIKLVGTYDFKLPEVPYAEPYVCANLLSTKDTCTMNVDVSNCSNSRLSRVPLIKFMGELDGNTKSAMNTMTNTSSKLVVKANGVDVKERVSARLEWSETDKTLYYKQTPPGGLRIIIR